MNTIKWELEDLSFAALYPKVYEEIVRMVGDRTPEREKSLSVIRNQIADDLRTAGSRPRSPAGPSTITRSTKR
jgi:guanosine-3',5'-bis(diphosphate) 3'-pyrophosphohydrolase